MFQEHGETNQKKRTEGRGLCAVTEKGTNLGGFLVHYVEGRPWRPILNKGRK